MKYLVINNEKHNQKNNIGVIVKKSITHSLL